MHNAAGKAGVHLLNVVLNMQCQKTSSRNMMIFDGDGDLEEAGGIEKRYAYIELSTILCCRGSSPLYYQKLSCHTHQTLCLRRTASGSLWVTFASLPLCRHHGVYSCSLQPETPMLLKCSHAELEVMRDMDCCRVDATSAVDSVTWTSFG